MLEGSMRERQLNIRLSVAEHYALNAASLFRMLVKREFDSLNGGAGGTSAAILRDNLAGHADPKRTQPLAVPVPKKKSPKK
jgi:hypothetical protein